MKKILVTGCAGFIGSHFTERMLQKNYHVTGLDNMSDMLYSEKYKHKNIGNFIDMPSFSFIQGDIRNYKGEFDAVVNFAAHAGQRFSWENTQEYFDNNAIAPTNLFQACASEYKPFRFIQISTSSIYGRVAEPQLSRLSNPHNPYGISKLAGEMFLSIQPMSLQNDLQILRLYSVYGPRQRPDMALFKMIDALIGRRKFSIFGNGEQSRTPTYVNDVVNAVELSLESEKCFEPLDIGSSEKISLNQMIKILEKISGEKLDIEYLSNEIGDQESTKANTGPTSKLLGFTAATSFEQGLLAQYEYQLTL